MFVSVVNTVYVIEILKLVRSFMGLGLHSKILDFYLVRSFMVFGFT